MGPRLCKRGDFFDLRGIEPTGNASMGPRLCKRGDPFASCNLSPCLQASMGPRLCKRGDQGYKVTDSDTFTLLQWGHAFASVETSGQQRRVAVHSRASMGPRLCKRGDCPSVIRSVRRAQERLCERVRRPAMIAWQKPLIALLSILLSTCERPPG